MKILVAGLDPSLTSTGVATPDGRTMLIKSKLKGPARLAYLRDAIEAQVLTASIVVIEGYSHGSRNKTHQIGELGGVIRVMLYELGIPYVEIPPNSLKKFATGSGKAEKTEVTLAAHKRLGYEGHSDDEADALWLREAGLQFYGKGTAKLPASQTKGLQQFAWPDLRG